MAEAQSKNWPETKNWPKATTLNELPLMDIDDEDPIVDMDEVPVSSSMRSRLTKLVQGSAKVEKVSKRSSSEEKVPKKKRSKKPSSAVISHEAEHATSTSMMADFEIEKKNIIKNVGATTELGIKMLADLEKERHRMEQYEQRRQEEKARLIAEGKEVVDSEDEDAVEEAMADSDDERFEEEAQLAEQDEELLRARGKDHRRLLKKQGRENTIEDQHAVSGELVRLLDAPHSSNVAILQAVDDLGFTMRQKAKSLLSQIESTQMRGIYEKSIRGLVGALYSRFDLRNVEAYEDTADAFEAMTNFPNKMRLMCSLWEKISMASRRSEYSEEKHAWAKMMSSRVIFWRQILPHYYTAGKCLSSENDIDMLGKTFAQFVLAQKDGRVLGGHVQYRRGQKVWSMRDATDTEYVVACPQEIRTYHGLAFLYLMPHSGEKLIKRIVRDLDKKHPRPERVIKEILYSKAAFDILVAAIDEVEKLRLMHETFNEMK